MEEILASIRRIIADDDPGKTPPKASAPPAEEPPVQEEEIDSMLAQVQAASHAAASRPAPEPPADILDLTEQMAVPTPAPAFRTIDGQPDLMFEDSPPPAPPPVARPAVERRPDIDSGGLVSAATGAAVDSAFNTLAQTVLVQNGRTLEDLVKEMLRPLLKTWLDDNLPSMVERLVRAEIERVSRGRA